MRGVGCSGADGISVSREGVGGGRVSEGVEHKGRDLGRGTTRRGGTRQSMFHPSLQVSLRSIFSSSKGPCQTCQCVSSKRPKRGLAVGDGERGAEGDWNWRKWAWSCREKWEQGVVTCRAQALTCCFWSRGGVDPSIMASFEF